MKFSKSGKRSARKREKAAKVFREFAAGGVVFKKGSAEVSWFISKSSPSKDYPEPYWRLPKGWLDDTKKGLEPGPLAQGEKKATEEDLQKAAIREVREEGGIEANIVKKIGTEKIFFTWNNEKILKFVTFYLMEWKKDLPEGPGFETSEVAWLSFEDARKRLKHSGEKKMLDEAKALLDSCVQGNLV